MQGTAISLSEAQLVLVNATVAGNRTLSGGAGIGTSLSPGSEVTMKSVTVTRNEAAGSGGGLFNANNAANPFPMPPPLFGMEVGA